MKLEFLTDEARLVAICEAYWAIDNAGQFVNRTVVIVAKLFSVSSYEVTKIVSRNCVARSTDIVCKSCGAGQKFNSRTDFTSRTRLNGYICLPCIERHEAEVVAQKRAKLSEKLVARLGQVIDVSKLSVRKAVFLAALLRFAAAEDCFHISPYSTNRAEKLSPYFSFDSMIISELYDAGIIAIDPQTNVNDIQFNDGDLTINIENIAWLLCSSDPVSVVKALELRLANFDFLQNSREECRQLANELALVECLAFLEYSLSHHRLRYSFGEKTVLVLSKGIECFSVAEMYNLIWKSAIDSAAYSQTSGITKDRAAKSVLGNIEKRIERFLAHNWTVFAYRRKPNNQQSVISRVLFNSVLHTDDGGFSSKISSLFENFDAVYAEYGVAKKVNVPFKALTAIENFELKSGVVSDDLCLRRNEILILAVKILKGEDAAKRWLRIPKVKFNGKSPNDVMDSDDVMNSFVGCDEVEKLLQSLYD